MFSTKQTKISDGWTSAKMGDLFDFKNGVNADKAQYGSGSRFINVMEVINHDALTEEMIPGRVNLDVKSLEKNVVEYGDILFNRTSETPEEIGLVSVYIGKEKVVFGGFVIRARAKTKDLLVPFRRYCFSAKPVRSEIIKRGQGAVRSNIGQEDLSDISIQFPPIPEQRRIVGVLEVWDQTIDKLKRKIEIKKEANAYLMRELLSGNARLPGYSQKWNELKLGDISTFINGYTFESSSYTDNGSYKIITIANVQDGYMFIEKPKLISEIPSNINDHQILKRGDILISMTGNVGRVCVVNEDNCLLNQRVGKIIPKGLNGDLLYLFLHDRIFLKAMIDSAQGGAQGNLSTADIKEYRFDAPSSIKEQSDIAGILNTSSKEIELLENKLKALIAQKTYLLNNLVTGTIRTPETLSVNT